MVSVATALIAWAILSGLVFRTGLHLADSSYRELDALIEPDHAAPGDPRKTGGPGSLLRWEELGRAGREYVATGPSAANSPRICSSRSAFLREVAM